MSKTEIDNRVATNMDLLAADSSLGHAIDIRREFCREAAATLRRLDAENKALRDVLNEVAVDAIGIGGGETAISNATRTKVEAVLMETFAARAAAKTGDAA